MNDTRSTRGENDDFCTYYKIGQSRFAEQRHEDMIKSDASKITKEKLITFFGERHYVGCDSSHTRAEVEGNTWKDVLKNVLDDVEQFELSKSSDDIVEVVEDMQTNHKSHQYISVYVDEMENIFARVTFDDKTRDTMRASYRKMEELLDAEQQKTNEAGKTMLAQDHVKRIVGSLLIVAAKMTNECSVNELHTVWKNLYKLIFEATIRSSEPDMYVRDNGECEFKFQMGPLGEHETLAKPDLVIERRIESKSVDNWPRNFVRLFVIEMKTSMHGMKDSELVTDPLQRTDVSESGVSTCESDQKQSTGEEESSHKAPTEPPMKKQKNLAEIRIRTDYTSRMCNLQTQHFLELLCAMRDQRPSRTQAPAFLLTKCFGLYIVMHRVYLTCLNVEKSGLCSEREKSRFIMSDKFDTPNKNGTKFRMVCSKYLNLFKPGHFKALVAYLNFMSWHEYKLVPAPGTY